VALDRAAGLRPFCVAASAGTVNAGAIDPLDQLAGLCQAEGLWLHVDGAYGAVGAADPALTARYAGLARADSVALDPHKWLSVPVECGCALVRDGQLPSGHLEPGAPNTFGPRRARGSAGSPGTPSTDSSRPAASGRSSFG
jgi:glutamate/tyrosine decarboxylase-like PLP-dependent enzyme